MLYKGIFKRILPFLLTFAAGLFIASFFVSIAAPNFSGFRRGSHKVREYKHEYKQMKIENERLRQDNERLRRELEVRTANAMYWEDSNFHPVPPVTLDEPPPPPPRAPRHRVNER